MELCCPASALVGCRALHYSSGRVNTSTVEKRSLPSATRLYSTKLLDSVFYRRDWAWSALD